MARSGKEWQGVPDISRELQGAATKPQGMPGPEYIAQPWQHLKVAERQRRSDHRNTANETQDTPSTGRRHRYHCSQTPVVKRSGRWTPIDMTDLTARAF